MTEWSAGADEVVLLGADTPEQDPETVRAAVRHRRILSGAPRARRHGSGVHAGRSGASHRGPSVVLSHRCGVVDSTAIPPSSGATSAWQMDSRSPSSASCRDCSPDLDLRAPDLWLPLGTRARLPFTGDKGQTGGTPNWFGAGGTPFMFIHARLAPGARLEAAQSELRLLVERQSPHEATRREAATSRRTCTRPPSRGSTGPGEMAGVGLVLGAAISVLLIASVTVANLMLARAAARRREMGVRLALGASRFRVVRSWMTECFLLSLVSAAAGVVIAWWTLRAILLSPTFTQTAARAEIPDHCARHGAGCVGARLPGGPLPFPVRSSSASCRALRATRQDPIATMRGSAAGATQGLERVFLRRGLVVSQVALTTVLLLASAMMVRGVQEASTIDPGFNRHDVIAVSPSLAHNGYDSVRTARFMEEFRGAPRDDPRSRGGDTGQRADGRRSVCAHHPAR